MRTKPDLPYAEIPNHKDIILGPSDHPKWLPEGEDTLHLHIGGRCIPLNELEMKIPKLSYTFCVIDILYDLGEAETESSAEITSIEDFTSFVDTFKNATSATSWSLVCFCSHQQTEQVFDVLNDRCGSAERHVWVKSNVQRNVNAVQATNAYENFVIGIHCPEGTKRMDWQMNYGRNPEGATNVHHCSRVMKPYYYGKEVRFT